MSCRAPFNLSLCACFLKKGTIVSEIAVTRELESDGQRQGNEYLDEYNLDEYRFTAL